MKKLFFTLLATSFYFTTNIANATSPEREIKCLATNIYHESKGESDEGKVAVGAVVLNRVKDYRWPKTICEVVYQKDFVSSPKSKVCQFSWSCVKNKHIDFDSDEWKTSYQLAENLYNNSDDVLLNGATHFHASYIPKPAWTKSLKYVKRIDNHIFYKME